MAKYEGSEPDTKTKKAPGQSEGEVLHEAMERYERAEVRERENMELAYEDLEFRAGEQWDEALLKERQSDGRPALTFNRMPQFVRQTVNDIRLMRPSIRVVGVDENADKDTAEVLNGMLRYVENRSDAQAAYYIGADQQVTCGIGHWQIVTEYASEKTFDQEIRVLPIDDGIAVMWDPDSVLPTREDALWCFQPIDITHASFKSRFPDATLDEITAGSSLYREGWYTEDYVRIARYWCKKPIKRKLALLPDGKVIDLTDDDDGQIEAQVVAEGQQAGIEVRIESRNGYKITHCMMSSGEILEEEQDWPGSFIPIIPCLGEEVRIGRRVVRHGMIRYAKDAQRMFNYAQTLQVETVALQPKAPFMVTETNVKKFEAIWQDANNRNAPFLPYEPDPKNGGAMPQRAPAAIASQGARELIEMAGQNMKDIIGIQDAGLGSVSNETSGRAILARQGESDVGMFTYIDNFSRAIRHTGTILIDLIPHIYDTARTIRVMGEDGAVDTMQINNEQVDAATGERKKVNDLTVGAYDVVVEQGPGYTTRREEAKQGMLDLLKMLPDAAPLVLDLVAKAQDWPMADKIAERFKTLLPPPIQAKEAEDAGGDPPPATQPSPMDEAAVKEAMAKASKAEIDVEIAKVELELKQVELAAKKLDDLNKGFDTADRMLNPMASEMAPPMPVMGGVMPVPRAA